MCSCTLCTKNISYPALILNFGENSQNFYSILFLEVVFSPRTIQIEPKCVLSESDFWGEKIKQSSNKSNKIKIFLH